MKHVFITSDGSLKARWQGALPDAIAVTSDQAITRSESGDVVWITTTVEDWRAQTTAISRQGASVVVMSYAPNDREALLALELGARGYTHTLSAPEVLKQVALVVTHQGVWVGQSLLSRVLTGSVQALQQRTGDDITHQGQQFLATLTERERAVALAVARGGANKEVARELAITERTVKAHLSAIFKKLAVRDRLQLILKLSSDAEKRIS
ncbi:response regulator transcription factor [Halomonas sp. PAMB 3232]|uniref:response regulator transcription factor n=1 Tax=Halomonas sp. PAMB 3232 TaxID=3075221 RepID=UPI002898AE7A|nr:response regulator transcription factor [Halomonas sp. PAMB 3232]WNL40102.1 response regulator transcription factor [Halomonas sp. PAMB 3232]